MKRITAIAIAFTAMLGSFYVGDSAAEYVIGEQPDYIAVCAEAVELDDAGEDKEQIAEWLSHSRLNEEARAMFWTCFNNGGDK